MEALTMRSSRTKSGIAGLVVVLGLVAVVQASPSVNSAVLHTRIWNDDADSVLTWGNSYPSQIFIDDAQLDGDGAGGEWANRHSWRFSENGFTDAVFNNGDGFAISSDVVITGPANSEAALEVEPWWGGGTGGGLTVITWNGEIAAFGGRLPFYSFTTSHGLSYTKGDTIGLGMIYTPNSLTELDPATIEYTVDYDGSFYTSGPIPFDEGNPAEGYGSWGMLDNTKVGAYFLPQIVVDDPTNWSRVEFNGISYVPEPASLALLVLGGVAALRRRR